MGGFGSESEKYFGAARGAEPARDRPCRARPVGVELLVDGEPAYRVRKLSAAWREDRPFGEVLAEDRQLEEDERQASGRPSTTTWPKFSWCDGKRKTSAAW